MINFSNSFSLAITKYTQLPRIVIIAYSNISPIVIKFKYQKTSITLLIFASAKVIDVKSNCVRGEQEVTAL